MNDEQLDLARRLAAHPRFELRAGMRLLDHETPWVVLSVRDGRVTFAMDEVTDLPINLALSSGDRLDLTDAATGGVLLDMLGSGYLVERFSPEVGVPWSVRRYDFDDGPFYVGKSLAEACARALLAEWETTPATP